REGGGQSSGNASTSCWVVQAEVGCSVTSKWRTRRRWWASTTKTKRTRSRALGTTKKSIETRSRTWFARNVRHVCDGGKRLFGISRETVRSATSRPSLRSSLWIRGAPQRGFAVAMRVIKVLISAWTAGRPPVEGPESLLQYSRKRRRCHRRTVSAVTITRGCLHPAQTLASPIQKRR